MAKLLFYCTKSKIRLFFDKLIKIFALGKIPSNNDLNGKIVAECDFEVEEKLNYGLARRSELELKGTCLTMKQLDEYLPKHKDYDDKDVYYYIHIKNLHIFDKPKELSEYYTLNGRVDIENVKVISKAPQNMMYAFELTQDAGLGYCKAYLNKNILISIHPEWLCKILNGEKTIEFRKKVLKEMLK